MNSRSRGLRGSGVPSQVPEAAAPPDMRAIFSSRNGIGTVGSRTTVVDDRKDRGQRMCDTASLSYFTDDTGAFDAAPPRSSNSSDKDLQRAEGSADSYSGARKEALAS